MGARMKTILRSFLHEFRSIFTNVGTLVVLGLAALIYGFFYPLPYQPQVAEDLPVVVVDGDRSAMSRMLIQFADATRSEEHTSELQSRGHLVCRLLLEKKKQ